MLTEAIPQEADIPARIDMVRKRISAAAERVGRDPAEVTLVAVTKTVPPAMIKEAFVAGVCCFGENRVQEAAAKIPVFLDDKSLREMPPQWHLVGHLQTNKVKKALELFSVIQAVDSLRLAEALQRQAAALQRTVEVFIEVNTSGEPTKFGVPPHETLALAKAIAALPKLRLTGLMAIGALTEDAQIIRRCFRQLRELYAEIAAANLPGVTVRHLSMGMTDDFEIAIEEGSTMVRIGRAIFGPRL